MSTQSILGKDMNTFVVVSGQWVGALDDISTVSIGCWLILVPEPIKSPR